MTEILIRILAICTAWWCSKCGICNTNDNATSCYNCGTAR